MASMNFEFKLLPSINKYNKSSNNKLIKTNLQIQNDESAVETKKCRYNSRVLVGNWFDKRSKYEKSSDNWLTVNTTTYNCKANPSLKTDRIALGKNKAKAEVSEYNLFLSMEETFIQHEGLGADLLIYHDKKAYHNNYVTTNSLAFQIFERKLCSSQIKQNIGRYYRRKGEMNKPYLNHLDIDENLPFQPHLVKSEI